MKRKIKLWIKARFNRARVRWRKRRRSIGSKLEYRPQNDITQELAISIVKKAIWNPDATMLIAPISGTRYIHYDDIFIKIDHRLITIINGTYTYHINISDHDTDFLLERFNFRLENVRKRWEETITAKTTRSLNSILEDLNNKINNK